MNRVSEPLLIQIGTVLSFMLIWEIVGESKILFEGIVPSVFEIMSAAWEQVASGFLLPHLLVTLSEAFAGFAIAVFFGVGLGLVLGANPFLRNVFELPILYFAATPKIILYPIFLMILGTKFESKMAMAAVSAFFPIVMNTAIAAAHINRIFLKVAKSVGASSIQTFVRVYLPSIVLPVFTGMRLGLGVALVGAILGELKVSNAGLGFIIMEAFHHFRIAEMYASIVLTFFVAGLVNLVMSALLARLRKFA